MTSIGQRTRTRTLYYYEQFKWWKNTSWEEQRYILEEIIYILAQFLYISVVL